ncbi:RNA-binding protein [Candidatus Woesearchaeota archaeon]|nr:RNA-binding protein [Candidatus Woesearchaeota archaeon]
MVEAEKSEDSVVFKCPKCNEQEISRTKHERAIATKYVCPGCGFEGPN